MEGNDTICAISTPPGAGGIGIIRISGPAARSILMQIFKPRGRKKRLAQRRLHLGYIFHPETEAHIDEVFAVFMTAPTTYTREEMAEVYSHGGMAAQRSILALMTALGARLAEPGEFTKRAFLNGRIDLTQAEAVLGVIQSETEEELQYVLRHLEGRLSRRINGFKENVKAALADVEALIDFPDEDIDVEADELVAGLVRMRKGVAKLVDSYYEGSAFTTGFEVLILGRTNVGKSSLLNALLAKDRAIVTPLPGTTRDLIEDTLHIRGVRIKLIDTAGIRMPGDIVERAGVERAKEKISQADLVLWVLDGSEPLTTEDEEILRLLEGKVRVAVINKSDLPQRAMKKSVAGAASKTVEVSALTDDGIDLLRETIYTSFMGRGGKRSGTDLVTNVRHRDALAKAGDALERSIQCIKSDEPLEFTALELREALTYLGEITGETCTEEILHRIFDRFCIGK
jgi:tRNA modification GTPase